MWSSLKKGAELYKYRFWKVLGIGLLIILPIQILYTFVVNYLSFPFYYYQIPLWPSMIQAVFMLIVLFLIQLPLISIVRQEEEEETVTWRRLLVDMLKYGFPAYIWSIPFALLTTLGLLLFALPGIALLILFLGIPFALVLDNQRGKRLLSGAFHFGKSNFFGLLGLLALFAVVDFLLGYGLSAGILFYTGQPALLNWAYMIVNILLLPIFTFSVSFLYRDWQGLEHEPDFDTDTDTAPAT